MTAILSVKSTEKLALGAAAVANTPVDYVRVVRIQANRNIHVSVGGDATVAHMPIAELYPVYVSVPANLTVSVIKGTGETDGDCWITEAAVI